MHNYTTSLLPSQIQYCHAKQLPCDFNIQSTHVIYSGHRLGCSLESAIVECEKKVMLNNESLEGKVQYQEISAKINIPEVFGSVFIQVDR